MQNKQKTAIVTGVTGQDGSYLADFLLKKNYRVVGLQRKTSNNQPNNIGHLLGDIELTYCDLLDNVSLVEAIKKFQPDELYNLAAQSHVGESWRMPIQTAEITGVGALRIYEAVRQAKPDCKIYQASTSEMFGKVKEIPQTESTPFNPANPYACCKLFAHSMANVYRNSYKMFIACGILFNHESPKRGMGFVTQKIAYGAACAKLGIKNATFLNEEGEPIVKNGKLSLGNLDAKRDWGFAGDFVEAMWLMLQQDTPDDFVVATGEVHNIEDFCQAAYGYVGLDFKNFVITDPRFVRPMETGPLVGNAQKAQKVLGWKPKTTFEELVAMMVDAHLARLK